MLVSRAAAVFLFLCVVALFKSSFGQFWLPRASCWCAHNDNGQRGCTPTGSFVCWCCCVHQPYTAVCRSTGGQQSRRWPFWVFTETMCALLYHITHKSMLGLYCSVRAVALVIDARESHVFRRICILDFGGSEGSSCRYWYSVGCLTL